MHIIIALIGAVIATYFFLNRAQRRGNAVGEIIDMAEDVRLAARRFGFKQRTNVHPVEATDETKPLTVAATLAFLSLDARLHQNDLDAVANAIVNKFGEGAKDANEMIIFSDWLVSQCTTPDAALARTTKRLFKLRGIEAFEPLMTLIKAAKGSNNMSEKQTDALHDIAKVFRI